MLTGTVVAIAIAVSHYINSIHDGHMHILHIFMFS